LDRSTLFPSVGLDTGSIIIRTAVPTPTSDLISIAPPLSWTNRLTWPRPRPEPRPNWLRREIGVERLPKHFVRHAASVLRDDDFYHLSRRSSNGHTVLRQDYDLATQRCARIATQIEESEVKILWIGHKIGEILGNIGVE
jgi:hypothetical protein